MNAIHTRQNPLDSRQINAFASLARTGCLADTARELSLTNSAISHSMRALESDLGCRLLNRLGKRVVLTAAGEAFLHYAQNGLKSFAQARQTVQDFKQWGGQPLRIGAGAALFQHLLPAVLSRLKEQHPNLLLTAKVVRSSEIAASLRNGELDIILGSLPDYAPEIKFMPWLDAPLRIVVGSKHRWAAQGCLPAKELAKEPCFLPERSHPTRQLIDRYFEAYDIVINGVPFIESLDVIKEFLRQGIGMSILPDWVVKDELKAGTFAGFPPGRRRLRQTWGIMCLHGHPVSPIESTFEVLCAEAAKSFNQSTE
jgi:DNA-binding transcriptional LysR family regulator